MSQDIHPHALWVIQHEGHFCWYQRALVVGDFKPGSAVRPEYVMDADGRLEDPDAEPRCRTCGFVPTVGSLEAFERRTGRRFPLDDFRAGRAPWPAATNPDTCWHCNCPGERDPVSGMCLTCVGHCEAEAAREARARARAAAMGDAGETVH